MADKYLFFGQNGVKYNLYDMPKGFVILGDLDLSKKDLTELPDLSEVIVEGNFDCSNNKLTSLKGAPKEVGRNFWCKFNQLTSLDGAPHRIGGNLICNDNRLTTLRGTLEEIGGSLFCCQNELDSLKGMPKLKPTGDIFCDMEVAQKYGFPRNYLEAMELYTNPIYISETLSGTTEKIKTLKENVQPSAQEKRAQALENTKAAFETWLKKKGIEPR